MLQSSVSQFLKRFQVACNGPNHLDEKVHNIAFEVAKAMKCSMISREFSKFALDDDIAIATLLDPRFKMFGFGECLPGTYSHDASDRARKLLYKLVSQMPINSPQKDTMSCNSSSPYFLLEARKAKAHSRLAPLLDSKMEVDR